jgi:hypothetical protein
VYGGGLTRPSLNKRGVRTVMSPTTSWSALRTVSRVGLRARTYSRQVERRHVDNLVLVLGAGASRDLGSNGKKMPLMEDWNNILRGELDVRQAGLSRLVGIQENQSGPDFEKALGRFLQWRSVLDLAARFLPLGFADPSQCNKARWQDQAEIRARMVDDALNRTLYAEFGEERASRADAHAAYEALLRALTFNAAARIVVATTNYDPAAELAFEELELSPDNGDATGRGGVRRLSPEGLVGRCQQGRQRAVLHLHGKVGWYNQSDGSVEVHNHRERFNDSAGVPTIVWPDPAKNPENDPSMPPPIRVLWHEFRQALQQATHVLVIGHSLNDPTLVEAINASSARKAVSSLSSHDDTETLRLKHLIPTADIIFGSFGPYLRSGKLVPFLGNLAAWSAPS